MNTTPLISVAMITYNHEKFIGQAIDNILMQETDYPFELVIGEDYSKDNTRRICLEYKEKYPEKIKLLLPEKNIGIRKNFNDTLHACSGKYIAVCEGDDFWIDPLKLQKQASFLEDHPDYAAYAHRAYRLFETGEKDYYGSNIDSDISLNDLLKDSIFHTSTIMFRQQIIKDKDLPDILSFDRTLFMLCGISGKIKYSKEIMSTYREHPGGISKNITPEIMKKDFNIIKWISDIYPQFPGYKYRSFIHRTIYYYSGKISIFGLIKHYILSSIYTFSYFPNNWPDLRERESIFRYRIKQKLKRKHD